VGVLGVSRYVTFAVGAAPARQRRVPSAMPRFRHPDRHLRVQIDAELDAMLGEDHLARFIWTVLERSDLSVFEARYRSQPDGPGRSAIHPRLLAALWIYGLSQGMETAAEIARACTQRDDFRWLAGGVHVSDQTLLNFLQASPDGFTRLWQQLLRAMQQDSQLDLSTVFEDGSKVRANASPSSFVTEAQVLKTVSALEVQLAAAKAAATGERSARSRIGSVGRAQRMRSCALESIGAANGSEFTCAW
jgi:transposase